MRFNGKKYRQIMEEKGLSIETVCHKTGLLQNSVEWILSRGFASEEAMERFAEAAGVTLGDVVMQDISGTEENVIEFIKDEERATVTFSQRRYVTRIKKLAEEYPEECEIVAENQDGSVYAHIPVDWIRINPGMNLTDEQKGRLAERARNIFHADKR